MASHSAEIVSGLPSGNPSSGPAIVPAPVRDLTQPAGTNTTVWLELIECGLREQQFSEAVAKHLCLTVIATASGECLRGLVSWGTD